MFYIGSESEIKSTSKKRGKHKGGWTGKEHNSEGNKQGANQARWGAVEKRITARNTPRTRTAAKQEEIRT